MIRQTSARWGGALVLTGAALVAAPRLGAQAPIHQTLWAMTGLQTGLCVQFLVSPTSAELLVKGGTPTPVESVASSYPALARVAEGEGAYHGWIPAEYCWYAYGSAVAGGRAADVDHGRTPVTVGYLSLLASGLPDSADAFAVLLFTNASGLDNAASLARVRVDRFKFSRTVDLSEGADSTIALYQAKHAATLVQWEGGPGASQPPPVRTVRLSGTDIAGGRQWIRATITADSAFVPSGSLRITPGTQVGDLLAASPIRLVTPFLRGGNSDWTVGR